MSNYQQKQAVLFEQLKIAEHAFEAACGCDCICHHVKVGHTNRCCFASQTLRCDIKADIDRIHSEIRQLENGSKR